MVTSMWNFGPSEADGKKGSKFTDWLAENVQNVENGTAVFQGQHVTRQSVLVRYYCCASLVFFTIRQVSPIFLEGSAEASKSRMLSSLITLVIGWFGLFGIVFAPVYLVKNLLGGEKLTVADLLDNTDRLRSSAADFEIGPVQIYGLIFLAAIGWQLYLMIRQSFPG